MPTTSLDNPPNIYFPISRGRYEINPGLHPLDTDFGNGCSDHHIFQFDDQFSHYHQAKQHARTEHLSKYYCTKNLSQETESAINRFIVRQLVQEHPSYFSLVSTQHSHELHCQLTEETLQFDADYFLINSKHKQVHPTYAGAIDALVTQLQEDLAIISLNSQGDSLCVLHLYFPNHWAAEEKIGRSFQAVHQPVPGMEKISSRAREIVSAMVHEGPYVRFACGLSSDTRLNHHPHPPDGTVPSI